MNLCKLKYWLIIITTQVFIVSAYGISVQFTYAKRSNCAPTIVEFTNNSTSGPGITYKWNFGLGAIVTTTDNSVKNQLYTKPGQYKITLVVTDGVNADSTSTIITIAQGPKANFTANPAAGCKPLLVNLVSTSVPGDSAINSTAWDFRNGDFINGTSVQYTYKNPGKYNIVLKVTDSNGCYSFLESDSIINVVNKPVANFAASDTFSCTPPLNVSFINLSTGSSNLSYKWDYGNGQTSTDLSNSIVYNAPGEYSVKLTTTDQYGCSDSITKKSYISIGFPQGIISVFDANNNLVDKSSLCNGIYRFVFSIDNLPDYSWIIHDNSNVTTFSGKNTLTYWVKDSGKLEIDLIYGKNSFCTENIQKTYTKSYVKVDFSLDTALICSLPHNVSLKSNSKNATHYSWYFNGRLISEKADTSYTITYADVPKDTYRQINSHVVEKKQVFFSLIATNNDGCSTGISQFTSITFPVARFVPNKVSGCAPLSVSLSDSSKSAAKIDEYIYKIGSQTVTSNDKTPVNHTFTLPGEYYISEIIKSAGCYDTSYAVKVVVGEKLIPDFTVSPQEVCNGGKIHIVGNSNKNSLVNTWRFSSPGIFDLNFISPPDTAIAVITNNPGFKNINLQVEYNGCFSDTTKASVFKIIGPSGNFKETFSCDSSLVYHFKSKIEPATSLTWNVDTATFKGPDSISYRFPAGGDYKVKLIALDNISNCTFSQTKSIKVRQIKAGFTLNDSIFCVGDSVLMNASSSEDYINTCYNEGFLWDFGDGSPPRRTYSITSDHIYYSKGNYKLNLIAKADNGCVDSLQKNVQVYRPVGSFTTDKKSGCLPNLNVNFTNTSTDTTIVNSIWDFDDKIVDLSQNKNVSHTYTSEYQKTFYPALKVYDKYQCYAAYTIPITLVGLSGDFQADDNAICAGQKVTFYPIDTNLDTIYWDFGDGNTSKTINSNTYSNSGKYNVALTVTKYGCSKSFTKSNYVNVEKADAKFIVSDSILYCYPETLYFLHKNLNGSPVIERIWNFETNEYNNTSDSVIYIYTHPGNYNAQLKVKTLNGCQASSSNSIVINGPTATASFTPKKICYNETVNFQIETMDNVSGWRWIFGDGNTSKDNPVAHPYTSQGYIIPAIELINNNCTVNKTLDTLYVAYQTIDYNRTPLGDTTINVGDSIRLSILTDANNMNYTWSPDYNITCLNCTSTKVAPYKDISYMVNIQDECIDISENFNIHVIIDYYLDAPSAFTPNGDFNNDIFKFEQKNIKYFDLKIFNRWGKIVFSTTDKDEGWDGKVNGNIQNMDTYTYYVKAETIYGFKFEKKGNFLLIK